ncbi:MAG: Obg family GTPase CgtA, partial [Clostridia bacterium]|nr:Obg family GTPase CgtA [Clostridia bacterium]
TRAISHVVDLAGPEGREPLDDFEKINAELKGYSEKLSALPQIVALNKCDCFGAEENVKKFRKKYGKKYKLFPITAVRGERLDGLVRELSDLLDTLPPAERIPADEFEFELDDNTQFEIFKDEEGAFVVVGGLVDMLCRNVLLNNPDSMAYFQRVLKLRGVFKELAKHGCAQGDTVIVGDVEFEYVE